MTIENLSIFGAHVISHKVFPDERGFFREWFKSDQILGIDESFSVQQANYSKSTQWVIRGIHYSVAPQGQAKIVTCANGVIVDVLIDLRVGSPSYLKVEYVELTEDSGRVVYIPTGVGHGFIVTSDSAAVVYLTSSGYAPEYEKAISPTDPDLQINWPLPFGKTPIISSQDLQAPRVSSAAQKNELPIF